MFWPLKVLLRHLVRTGDLTIVDAAGRRHRFGDASGLAIAVQFASRALEWRLAFDPQLALGVGFMRGDIIVERGTLYDFVALLASNAELHRLPGWARHCDRLRYGVRRIVQYNPARRARSNVAHHYDIPGTIYDLFLDRDRQYSCAYFQSGSTLEDVFLKAIHQ